MKGCVRKKALVTTCQQLLKLHFSTPKMLDFLILNWGRQLMQTEQLNDCGLTFFPFSLVIPKFGYHKMHLFGLNFLHCLLKLSVGNGFCLSKMYDFLLPQDIKGLKLIYIDSNLIILHEMVLYAVFFA